MEASQAASELLPVVENRGLPCPACVVSDRGPADGVVGWGIRLRLGKWECAECFARFALCSFCEDHLVSWESARQKKDGGCARCGRSACEPCRDSSGELASVVADRAKVGLSEVPVLMGWIPYAKTDWLCAGCAAFESTHLTWTGTLDFEALHTQWKTDRNPVEADTAVELPEKMQDPETTAMKRSDPAPEIAVGDDSVVDPPAAKKQRKGPDE